MNGEYLECLLDTGAFTSFISENYCNTRNFRRQPIANRKNWVTANGSPIEVNGQVELKLKIGNRDFNSNFIVAKDLSQEMIIGVDILSPNKCIIDFANNDLILGDSHMRIKTIEPLRAQLVHANCNIIVMPSEIETFWINIDRKYDTVLVSKAGKNNVIEMVTQQRENKIPVFLTNPTKVPKHIRHGDIIATITPIEILSEISNYEEMFKFIEVERHVNESLAALTGEFEEKAWKPGDRIKFSNKHLTQDQKEKLRNLVNKYYMIFSKNDADIGRVDKRFGQHDIKLKDDTPITQKPYKTLC